MNKYVKDYSGDFVECEQFSDTRYDEREKLDLEDVIEAVSKLQKRVRELELALESE